MPSRFCNGLFKFPPSQAYRRIKFDRCTINRLLSKILSSQPKEAVNDLDWLRKLLQVRRERLICFDPSKVRKFSGVIVFKMFPVHFKTKSWRFQISPVWRVFSNSSLFVTDYVDSRLKRKSKAVFSNFLGVVWTLAHSSLLSKGNLCIEKVSLEKDIKWLLPLPAPFNNKQTVKFKAQPGDKCVFHYRQSND